MGFLQSLIDTYQTQMERNRNHPFLKATMAACSLVAMADGKVSFNERVRVDQILETLEALKIFDPHEGVDLFNEFTDMILASPGKGHEMAVKCLQDGAGDDETKALLIRICCAVSEAKGAKSLVDQIEIVSLCSRLGIEPAACGLYTDGSPEDLIKGGD